MVLLMLVPDSSSSSFFTESPVMLSGVCKRVGNVSVNYGFAFLLLHRLKC